MKRAISKALVSLAAVGCMGVLAPTVSQAQTGVSDDRVSLPEGPGSLEGVGENVEMDPNMGNMRHSIPINVPQGFAGVTPSLSLNYTSGGGGSVVGMGWSMNIPSIERMTYRGLPKYSVDDDFCANTSDQLVLIPGSNPPEYRARFEKGFIKYSWIGAGNGAQGYWKAEYPDGSIGYFGAHADGTLVEDARMSGDDGTFRYMLVEKVDVHGHKAVYSYQKFDAVPLVSGIAYAYVADPGSPTYEVEFTYEERRDSGNRIDYLSDAKPGFNELLTQRLAKVDVLSRDVRIRSYELNYEEYDVSGGFTRLTQVKTLGLENGVYPVVQSFSYSQALGADCMGEQCEDRPYVASMGTVGVSLTEGSASLLDINGDALPDLVDTTQNGPHRFFINTPSADGSSSFDANAISSSLPSATGANFRMGRSNPGVQMLDSNGDGFTDLLNAITGEILINKGNGDWESGDISGVQGLSDALVGDVESLRFIDYNNDKKIDLMRASQEGTSYLENRGDTGFTTVTDAQNIEASFAADGMQMADMNGDGLQDVVQLLLGQLRYRLNYGWGDWSAWYQIDNLPLSHVEIPLADVEDINGDGMADLVVVNGPQVKFALNKNNDRFTTPTTLDGSDIADLPQRDAGTHVLYADMNANGSTDIVWIDQGGHVQYLELFPARPNLMTRIENGLGQVTKIKYGSSVQEMARDKAEGLPDWSYKLPHPMLVVTELDKYELLTNVHEVTQYRYHNGYYDGVEKQFRGYERVEAVLIGDDSQENGVKESVFDVGTHRLDTNGNNVGPYYNGLLLSEKNSSAGRDLNETVNTYSECDVAEVPSSTDLAVKFICQTQTENILKEGADTREHVLTRSSSQYDGYGNVVRSSHEGVASIGGQGCEPCAADRDDDEFGKPCGQQCIGDESFTQTDFVAPRTDTNGRWIINAPYRERNFGRDGSQLTTETLTYYDGAGFVGMELGQLDKGLVSRVTNKVNAGSEDVINVTRNAHNAHGKVIESMDPNGEAGVHEHRRQYTYEEDKLRVVRAEVLLKDKNGDDYRLRRDVVYEPFFDKIAEGTDWLRVVDGNVVSTRRSTSHIYDEFGRILHKVLPGGDSSVSPTEEYSYALGSPISRRITKKRSRVGGPLDIEVINCMDGRGRSFQTRTKLDNGLYQVNGFTVFNVRSNPVRMYQPYTSTSSDCDTAAPEGTLFSRYKYDASYRQIEMVAADASIYGGTASASRTVYAPLTTLSYDQEDTDPNSPHADTPTINRMDGMDRLVAIERLLGPGESEVTKVHYDSLGRMTGYTDAAGNRKTQTYDLLDRITVILDPNTADETTFVYDAAGNVLRSEDDRRVVTLSEYDGMNRLIKKWDEANPEGSAIVMTYDFDGDCDRAKCTHGEGKLVSTTYPGPADTPAVDQMGYDLRGRTIHRSQTLAGFPFEFALSYDNADRAISARYPDGQVIERTYDDASRLSSIEGLIPNIAYDERNLMNSASCNDGSGVTVNYDAIMRPSERITTGTGGVVLQGFGYNYGRSGNINSIEDLGEERSGKLSYKANYTYDAWYRTLKADLNGGDQGPEIVSFGFDGIDNITNKTSSRNGSKAHVGMFSYGKPNAVASAGGISFSYDAAGYMTGRGDQTMNWDFMGRMTGVSDADGQVAQFTYGSNQSRVAKQEGDSTVLYPSVDFEVRDGISVLYVKMGNKRVARIENDALATSVLSDIQADGQINAGDAWLSGNGAAGSSAGELLWSSVRRLLVETGPTDGTTYLHHDHLSSITLATNNDGNGTVVVGERSFYLLGQVRQQTGYVDEYGFTGQEIDRSTGLLHFDWRYYDPNIGRWASIDPLFAINSASNITKLGESTTGYAYVAGNFSNVLDPTGLSGVKGALKFMRRKFTTKNSKWNKSHKLKKANGKVDKPLGWINPFQGLTKNGLKKMDKQASKYEKHKHHKQAKKPTHGRKYSNSESERANALLSNFIKMGPSNKGFYIPAHKNVSAAPVPPSPRNSISLAPTQGPQTFQRQDSLSSTHNSNHNQIIDVAD